MNIDRDIQQLFSDISLYSIYTVTVTALGDEYTSVIQITHIGGNNV